MTDSKPENSEQETVESFLEKTTPYTVLPEGGKKIMKFKGDQIAAIVIVPKGAAAEAEYPMYPQQKREDTKQMEETKKKLDETEKKLSDELEKTTQLSKQVETLTGQNKVIADEIAAIKLAEVKDLSSKIVEIRLSKGLAEADQAEATKTSLSQLPATQLRVLLSDLEKLSAKTESKPKPKAAIDSHVQLSDEDQVRMKMFGHTEKLPF